MGPIGPIKPSDERLGRHLAAALFHLDGGNADTMFKLLEGWSRGCGRSGETAGPGLSTGVGTAINDFFPVQ